MVMVMAEIAMIHRTLLEIQMGQSCSSRVPVVASYTPHDSTRYSQSSERNRPTQLATQGSKNIQPIAEEAHIRTNSANSALEKHLQCYSPDTPEKATQEGYPTTTELLSIEAHRYRIL